jgi:hypothetical protein
MYDHSLIHLDKKKEIILDKFVGDEYHPIIICDDFKIYIDFNLLYLTHQ